MTLDEFVAVFAGEFEETPQGGWNGQTKFRELPEWGSLSTLSVLSAIDDEFDIVMTGSELRQCTTIEDAYKLALTK